MAAQVTKSPQMLKGTVKAVPSGDSLLVMGNDSKGAPPEKTITLAAIIAPKLARRDGKDEPFAWQSREALRKKCIGKVVSFQTDYVVPSIGREFGTVLLDGQNVAFDVVGDGWAKVRQQGGQGNEVSSAYMQELEHREAKAQEDGLGIWNKTTGAADGAIRDLPPSAIGDQSNFDAMGFLEANKGKPLPAIVEQVRDGSAIRAYLLPDFQFVQVYVAGVQAPSMGRRAPAGDAQVSANAAPKAVNGDSKVAEEGEVGAGSVPAPLTTAAQKLAASNAAAASAEVPPDPFAREAKHFTEVRVLNRDVRIVLEGVDKYRNLIGSVHYANGDVAADLALELVKQGLARVVEWSVNMMDEEPRRALKAAELQAKKDRIRLWTNYVPPASNSTAIQDVNFSGKVIEVVSGDCVVVADDAAPFGTQQAERRVNLSSIRAPKIGNPRRDEKPSPYAREAKEFLRSRLIGQQVNVTMEYSRKIAPTDGPTPIPSATDTRMMDFGSVFLLTVPKGENLETVTTSGSGDQPQGINVAEMVVVRGLATVVKHRDFEERSNFYDSLMSSESRAQKVKKGLHSGKATPAAHINDLSVQGTSSKARNFLPFLQRSRRLPAIVDYVLSGHRFKLLIPKETCAIAFSLSGVRCPGRGEPFSDEAITFMRQKIMQRDVEIEVETVDKTGTFLGSLWEGKANVSVALLEAGLAKLHPLFTADRTTDGHLLVQSELVAKKQQLKVWEGYVEGEADEKTKATTDGGKLKQEVLEIRVTEVLGGGKFYAQTVGDARLAGILQQLEAFRLKDKPLPPGTFSPKKGDLVIAQYTVDNSWNRALVVNAPKQPSSGKAEFEIFYIDYGNQELAPLSRLRPADGSVSSTQGLAQLYSLAHIKVPELEDDNGQEAAVSLSEQIGGKTLVARVEDKDTTGGKVKGQGTGPRLIVTLGDAEKKTSYNAVMVEGGLARVEKKGKWDSPEKKAVLDELCKHEETARKDRLYIWQYGDAGSDDEEVLPSRGRGGGRH